MAITGEYKVIVSPNNGEIIHVKSGLALTVSYSEVNENATPRQLVEILDFVCGEIESAVQSGRYTLRNGETPHSVAQNAVGQSEEEPPVHWKSKIIEGMSLHERTKDDGTAYTFWYLYYDYQGQLQRTATRVVTWGDLANQIRAIVPEGALPDSASSERAPQIVELGSYSFTAYYTLDNNPDGKRFTVWQHFESVED